MESNEELNFKDGFTLLIIQGKMIALMPLEQWLEDFERADTTGPILNPTLYRDYIYSGRDVMIKEVLRGAIQLKSAILKAQDDILAGRIK